MNIDKNDIEVLDFIIEKILEFDYPIESNAIINNGFLNEYNETEREYEFSRLISVINDLKCGKSKNNYSTPGDTIERNEQTLKFKKRGGFKKYYQDELIKKTKEEEIKQLSNIKLFWDSKLSKWQVKTFWPVFVFGLVGFIFGLYNFIDNLNKTESIEVLKQNNQYIQEEVSRLRTLVLDQKTVGSLHSSRTQIDSLKPR